MEKVMNKAIQATLAALAFGICATSVYAGDEDRGSDHINQGNLLVVMIVKVRLISY